MHKVVDLTVNVTFKTTEFMLTTEQTENQLCANSQNLLECQTMKGSWHKKQACWQQLVQTYADELAVAQQRLQTAIDAQQQAENSLKRYRLLFEQAHDPTFILRSDGQITEANYTAAQQYGYEYEELLTVNILTLISFQSHAQIKSFFAQARQENLLLETSGCHKNGDTFSVEVNLKRILDEDKTIFLTVIRDLSECEQLKADLEESEAKNQALVGAANVQAQQFSNTLKRLQETQTQLIQTEKMSSLGQLVAGIAHEINNPVNFICGNLFHINHYTKDLLALIQLYQQRYPKPDPDIQTLIETIDLDFLSEDFLKLITSMEIGVDRIRNIVLSLRNFSRLDEADVKLANIHEGIDNTLLILNHRIKKGIEIIKQYQDLPLVECYPAQLNQVFMNILTNAIDALQTEADSSQKQILVATEITNTEQIKIRIRDNGPGISNKIKAKLFDPFFTTKPVGQGTGLGLSICYQIVEKHRGKIDVISELGQGTEFVLVLPLKQEP